MVNTYIVACWMMVPSTEHIQVDVPLELDAVSFLQVYLVTLVAHQISSIESVVYGAFNTGSGEAIKRLKQNEIAILCFPEWYSWN